MTKFAETLGAFDKGIDKTPAVKAVSLIGMWEKELSSIDTPGAKGIVRDLEALRKHLDKPEPDVGQIGTILGRLGEATVRIAEKADTSGDKLTALGKALSKAG